MVISLVANLDNLRKYLSVTLNPRRATVLLAYNVVCHSPQDSIELLGGTLVLLEHVGIANGGGTR